MIEILKIKQEGREKVDAFIKHHWFSMQMVVHGESIDLGIADGWYAFDYKNIVGLITYRVIDHEMEILSLNTLHENQGIGTTLLNQAIAKARESGCSRVCLITTNDNLTALRFYQKHGFDIVKIHRNAVDMARKLKPSIPQYGIDGIPIKHEIELEMLLIKKCT